MERLQPLFRKSYGQPRIDDANWFRNALKDMGISQCIRSLHDHLALNGLDHERRIRFGVYRLILSPIVTLIPKP